MKQRDSGKERKKERAWKTEERIFRISEGWCQDGLGGGPSRLEQFEPGHRFGSCLSLKCPHP